MDLLERRVMKLRHKRRHVITFSFSTKYAKVILRLHFHGRKGWYRGFEPKRGAWYR